MLLHPLPVVGPHFMRSPSMAITKQRWNIEVLHLYIEARPMTKRTTLTHNLAVVSVIFAFAILFSFSRRDEKYTRIDFVEYRRLRVVPNACLSLYAYDIVSVRHAIRAPTKVNRIGWRWGRRSEENTMSYLITRCTCFEFTFPASFRCLFFFLFLFCLLCLRIFAMLFVFVLCAIPKIHK